MRGSGKVHRLTVTAALAVGVVAALGAQSLAATATVSTASAGRPPAVRPNAVGGLDCNGLSPIQRPVKNGFMCADPRGLYGGRFYENGHYIGHDEPSVRFLSGRRGSGSDVTMAETLPKDPFGHADGQPPRTRHHALVRAVHRAVALDHRLRPALGAAGTLQAEIGLERAARSASRAAGPRSSSCSSTRPVSRRSPTTSAVTTRTGARRSTSTAWSARATGRGRATTTASSRSTSGSSRPTVSRPGRRARSSATWPRSRRTPTRC